MSASNNKPLVYWFRRDLRLTDLPALSAAAGRNQPLVAVYVHDTDTPGQWAPGAASRWWLHHSLAALGRALAARGGELLLRQGDAVEQLLQLATAIGAGSIYFSRQYDPEAIRQENQLNEACGRQGIECRRFPGSLLHEPESIRNRAGRPFRVFTPFWKTCLANRSVGEPLDGPGSLHFHDHGQARADLNTLDLLPTSPDWAAHWRDYWQPGEAGAEIALEDFLSGGFRDYAVGRDFPARAVTSRLSAHLHFGELSPRQLWHDIQSHVALRPGHQGQADKFLSELGWREFSHHLLFHFPAIPEQPFNPQFETFPWHSDDRGLRAWQRGMTGYPVVDAGMRELWHTGYMHNRVRMIAASFLTKHLLLPWQLGARWFWDTLVDADLANNACGWQWVAGSGADAAPYFRIFNPTLQGRKFDPEGEYIRRWVPEIAGLPDKYLHEPAIAPDAILQRAGVEPGITYPEPIVHHPDARRRALDALALNRNLNQAD